SSSRRILWASLFMTTWPSVTWPSPPMATPPWCRTARIVVERNRDTGASWDVDTVLPLYHTGDGRRPPSRALPSAPQAADNEGTGPAQWPPPRQPVFPFRRCHHAADASLAAVPGAARRLARCGAGVGRHARDPRRGRVLLGRNGSEGQGARPAD